MPSPAISAYAKASEEVGETQPSFKVKTWASLEVSSPLAIGMEVGGQLVPLNLQHPREEEGRGRKGGSVVKAGEGGEERSKRVLWG